MPRDSRVLNAGHQTLHRESVRVTDATGLHTDANFTGAGFEQLTLDQLQRLTGTRNLNDARIAHASE
jgi:hypothetical protein